MGKSFKDGYKGSPRDGRRGGSPSHANRHAPRDAFADVVDVPAFGRRNPEPTPVPAAKPQEQQPQRTTDTRLLKSDSFRGDGKIFYIDAVENDRGKALRIAEVSKGKRTIIMVPVSLLAAFEMAQGRVTPTLVNP